MKFMANPTLWKWFVLLNTVIISMLSRNMPFIQYAILAILLMILLAPYFVMIIEPLFAISDQPSKSNASPPSASIIVPAYLPNEHHIIVDAVQHIIHNVKYGGEYELILVYNTPNNMHVEDELRNLQRLHKNLVVLKAVNSKSKAENLNQALLVAKGDIIAVYDADSRPQPDALEKAANWFAMGYDFVQGANIISNKSASLLSKIVATEFYAKFFISYLSRYKSAQVTYFCGSNGYWRKETLCKMPFCDEAFVEDIDCAIRSLLQGAKLAYDASIISYELAPVDWKAWWGQRLRWAIGWFQLLTKYQSLVLSCSWPVSKKLYWSFFLLWRRIAIPNAIITLTVICLTTNTIEPLMLLFLLICSLLVVWIASLLQGLKMLNHWSTKHQGCISDIFLYTLLFPAYDLLRTLTTVVAIFVRNPAWTVTPRDINCQTNPIFLAIPPEYTNSRCLDE